MRLAARICFATACIQVLTAIVLAAVSLGGRRIMLGTPPLAIVAGILFLTGLLTFIAGGVIGIVGRKRPDGDPVFAILNTTFAAGLLVLLGIGFAMQAFAEREREADLEAWRIEREQEEQEATFAGWEEAVRHREDYHAMLWEARLVLLPSSVGAAGLDTKEILGYRLVAVPEIELEAKFAARALLEGCDTNIKRLLLATLREADSAAYDRLLVHLQKHDVDLMVKVGEDYQRLGDYRFYAERERAIPALELDLHR